MEGGQFEKVNQWFEQLNRSLKDESLATRQMVENRFNALSVSMQNLLTRMIRLEEKMGKEDAEVVTLKLAVKRLEDEIEDLRSHL